MLVTSRKNKTHIIHKLDKSPQMRLHVFFGVFKDLLKLIKRYDYCLFFALLLQVLENFFE